MLALTEALATVAAAKGRPKRTRYSGRQFFVTASVNKVPLLTDLVSRSRSTNPATTATVQITTCVLLVEARPSAPMMAAFKPRRRNRIVWT